MASSNPPITLRVPSKYVPTPQPPPTTSSTSSPNSTFTSPPVEWLHRTWSVTHSTLAMWRTARNVRITYTPLEPATSGDGGGGSRPRIDDLVEYEKQGKTSLKTVEGIDTAASESGDTGSWDWKGKGVLGFVSSHWEIMGWGEWTNPDGATERWVVTWFAPTLFTKEGIDLYSDRREGQSPSLTEEILAALRAVDSKEIAAMVEMNMKDVEIKLPWLEK